MDRSSVIRKRPQLELDFDWLHTTNS